MYRQVHTSIWFEDWFAPLSVESKLLFLYLLTSPQMDICGFHPLSVARFTSDTGLTEIESRLAEIAATGRVVLFPAEGLVWLNRFTKYQGGGPKFGAAVHSHLASIPPIPRQAFLEQYPDTLSHTLSHTLSDRGYGERVEKSSTPTVNSKQLTVNSKQAAAAPPTPSDPRLAAAAAAYENSIGLISGTVSDLLKELVDSHPGAPPEWFTEAFREAARAKVKNLKYVDSILVSIEDQGFETWKEQRNGQHRRPAGKGQAAIPGAPRPRDIPTREELRADFARLQGLQRAGGDSP